MAYKNFIPEVWAEAINRELERLHVFAANCNRQYEGEVKKMGDSVRILGVGRPTITEVKRDSFTTLSAPETVEDTSQIMYIDNMAYFNYKVDDIDKRQAVGGLMEALSAETSEGLADVQDRAIANLAADTLAIKDASTTYQLTANNILEKLLVAHQKLMENDVPMSTKVTVTLAPWAATLWKQAMAAIDTDNSALLKNGLIGTFDGMDIKVSNNCYKDANDNFGFMVRTDRAIAFARPMIHTEPYRPELDFSDAVKGFILYGTKIVRPKEMIIMNCKATA